MTRTIAVIGGKGGVGKTTLASNLTYALNSLGEDVIAIDANMTTPNLGIHFGIPLSKNNLHDVLRGKKKLKSVIHTHPYGFKFIPSSISTKSLKGVDASKMANVTFNLTGQSDFVILDCAAGLGREAISAIEAADEILVITNPDMPSVTDALKTIDIAKKTKKDVLGVVVNKSTDNSHEMKIGDIRELLEAPVISKIPYDPLVPESISERKPVLDYSPNSPAATEIDRLAHKIAGRKYIDSREGIGLFDRIKKWFV